MQILIYLTCIIFAVGLILTISRGLTFAVVWYEMFMSTMIIAGETHFSKITRDVLTWRIILLKTEAVLKKSQQKFYLDWFAQIED